MKYKGSLASYDTELQESQLQQYKRTTPYTLQKKSEWMISQSPSQLTLNSIPNDQCQQQYQSKFCTSTNQNSSTTYCNILVNQTQRSQTTIKVFHEKYEIIKILKENKQCQIVHCLNTFTKEHVVAKICLQYQKFEIDNEIKVCTILQKKPHSNLMSLIETFTDKDTHIFIYEYMDGGTLYEFIKHKQLKLEEQEIRAIFKQVLKALQHLHSLNIVHRDIKLDNIMFKVKGDIKSLKLIDYGYTTFLYDTKGMKQRCGTPGYVAPEIYELSKPYNQLCDIYSLGALIHVLATGKRIYSSKLTHQEICLLNKLNQYEISQNLKCPLLFDLLKQMLQEASQRPSVEKCLIHPYFIKKSQLKYSDQAINQQIYNLSFPQFKNPFSSLN